MVMVSYTNTITISVIVSIVFLMEPSEPIQSCNANHYVQIRTSTDL